MIPKELLEYSPIALAALALGIEAYGHWRKAGWVAEVGIPLGGLTETLEVEIPLSLPRDWLDDYPIVSFSGARIAYKPAVRSDSAATCLGVVGLSRYGNATIFSYRCIARPWIPVVLAAIGSTVLLQTGDLKLAAAMVSVAVVVFAITLYFHKRKADEEYHVLTADLVQRAANAGR